MVVPGGFGKRGVEGKIETCKWCRLNDKPFLGICLGFQTAVIEFARNVLKLEDANSVEVMENTKYPVVIDMPEHNTGEMGGTMRLGKRTTVFKETTKDSILCKLLVQFLPIKQIIIFFKIGFMEVKIALMKDIGIDMKSIPNILISLKVKACNLWVRQLNYQIFISFKMFISDIYDKYFVETIHITFQFILKVNIKLNKSNHI